MMTLFPYRLRSLSILNLIAFAALSACTQKPGMTLPRPAMIQPIGETLEMARVIDVLDKGDEKAARKLLKQMIKHDPTDSAAKHLFNSLGADPLALLGAKSFDYHVQPGDRMIDLAQHFLGDRLKFYTLARYNGITIPASIKTGQVLRIPGDAPPPRPAGPSRVIRPVPPRPESIRPAAPTKPKPQETKDPARAAILRGTGLAALNQGQVARAVVLLHQAAALDPANPLIKRDLERAQRIRKTVKAKR